MTTKGPEAEGREFIQNGGKAAMQFSGLSFGTAYGCNWVVCGRYRL